jgi:Trypsin-like peptidase domain
MSHLRWYWIVVCSTSLLITGCGGKKTAEVIKAESQKSVALISHLKGHGVGFFIEGAAGVCTLLTAKHVVPDGKEISIFTMTSKLPFKPLDIRRADNVDLAVVTFKPLDGNCPFPTLKLGDSKDVVLTQPIYISSYPGNVNGQAKKQSFFISNVIDKTSGGVDGYELSYKTDTFKGTSGSPVLNEFGEIIAVHGRSYLDKDFKILGNDRPYLDLGVPINVYKQDEIFKLKELRLSDEQKSIVFDAKQPISKPTPTILTKRPDAIKPDPKKLSIPNKKDDKVISIQLPRPTPSPKTISVPTVKKDDAKPKKLEKPIKKGMEIVIVSKTTFRKKILKNHPVAINDSNFRATIEVELFDTGEPYRASIISTQITRDGDTKYLIGPGTDESTLNIEIPYWASGYDIKFNLNGKAVDPPLNPFRIAKIKGPGQVKRNKYRS